MADRTCSVPNCGRRRTTKGLCQSHWARLKKHGHVQAEVPIAPRVRRTGLGLPAKPAPIPHSGPCLLDGCSAPRQGRGYCSTHYSRLWRTGSVELPVITKADLQQRIERRREIERLWKYAEYQRNREYVLARHYAWTAANPDRMRLADAKKHRRRRSAPSIPFTIDQLAARMRYWGERCWICKGPWEAIDHVKPLAKGGWHMLGNLRPVCTSCNSRKNDTWPFVLAS